MEKIGISKNFGKKRALNKKSLKSQNCSKKLLLLSHLKLKNIPYREFLIKDKNEDIFGEIIFLLYC